MSVEKQPPPSEDPDPLRAAIQLAAPIVREYLRQIELENLRLQRHIAHLHAAHLSTTNEVVALKEEMKKLGHEPASEQLASRLKAARKRVLGELSKPSPEDQSR